MIYRLRCGESERRVARDMQMSRTTVRKYRGLAQQHGYLEADTALPDDATLLAALGAPPRPPRADSSVEAHAEVVGQLLEQGVEMTAIFARLRDDHGYTGSYSSVRRYVHRVYPAQPRVVVRGHTAPGEEAQVDLAGGAGV